MGSLEVNQVTRQQLLEHASEEGDLLWAGPENDQTSTERVGEMLKLIAAARECQYA